MVIGQMCIRDSCNARHLRIKHSVPFISVGPVYHNALTCCAALSCRTLRKENHLCSSTVSDTANMRIHERSQAVSAEEKILCRSPFRSGHMSAICARLSQRKRGENQRGGNLGVHPSCAPARRQRSSVRFTSENSDRLVEGTRRCV